MTSPFPPAPGAVAGASGPVPVPRASTGWLPLVASCVAVVVASAAITGAVWVATAPGAVPVAAPTVHAAASHTPAASPVAASRIFTVGDANDALLDQADAETAWGTTVSFETSTGSATGGETGETEIAPAGCAILYLGIDIRTGESVTTTYTLGDSGAGSGAGSTYVSASQTAYVFAGESEARAAYDELHSALDGCDRMHAVEGNASYQVDDRSGDYAPTTDPPTLVFHLYNGHATADNSWTSVTRVGNLLVETSVFVSVDGVDQPTELSAVTGAADFFGFANEHIDKMERD